MRAWWSVLFVPQRRTHLQRSCDCSLLCLEEPTTNNASGPLSLRMSSSLCEISSYAWSHEMRCHLPPESFIGYFRRCDSCVMPCSRTEAPLAQCAPRLSGESNTGSCRTHTPFCTTASIEQPTEQCVHTVRFTSSLPSSALASARSMMLNGNCEASAAPPTPIPERLRKPRRSMVFPATADTARVSRARGASWVVALRVSSMALSSDLGGAVVVVHVLARLIAARRTLVVRRSGLGGGRFRRHDRGGSGCATCPHREQKIASRELLRALTHERPSSVDLIVMRARILEHFKSRLLQ